jgi:hypothetical protein
MAQAASIPVSSAKGLDQVARTGRAGKALVLVVSTARDFAMDSRAFQAEGPMVGASAAGAAFRGLSAR